MNRTTLGDLRPVIAVVLGVCNTDSRIPRYVNEVQERLLPKGKYVGSVVRYRFCTDDSCLTLPRQIETIEAWWLCHTPMTVRDRWYEAMGNGPGMQDGDCGCASALIDRGTAVAYNDISSPASKINVVAAVAEAAGARILLQGYDESAQWIRTLDAGTWVDGEYVAISTTATRSTKTFTSLTGVIKPVTNGPVNLFEWSTALPGNIGQLAYYESDETIPLYRRYMVPGLSEAAACEDAQDDCDDKTVTVLAKLRHIPVTNDNDFLVLGNRAAFKLMTQAILKEERNLFAEAMAYEAKAVQALEDELSSYEGDGVVPVLRVADSSIFGGGAVENVITVVWR